jgi:DNA-binding LytR/AlgR family response regulator
MARPSAPRAVVAEDETVIRDGLLRHLATLWPDLHVVAVAENGLDAMCAVERHRPDVAFLDIQMPGLSGLEVARMAGERCHVVFVTAYDGHAVAAFEAGAIDYVLKPFDVARLARSVHRLRQRLQEDEAPARLDGLLGALAPRPPGGTPLRWITASCGDEVRLITVDEVCYFQADTKYTRVVTANSEALIRRALKDLQDGLDPRCFWQIHRSTIVNANAIAGVSRDFRGRVHVRLKARPERLAVSEAHEGLFRQM